MLNEENILLGLGLLVLAYFTAQATVKLAKNLGVPRLAVTAGVALASTAIAR